MYEASYLQVSVQMSVADTVTGTWSYIYDNLNRVITGTASAGYYSGAAMSWSYDPFGNRKSESVGGTVSAPMPSSSTASYTATSNQVSSVNNGAGLVYDAAGDVTQDPLNSYLYDAEGRLCAARTAGPSYTGYIYDAAGTRVAKGALTSFSCNFAANGFTPTASYVLGPGGEQVTEYAVSGGTSNWQHTNAFAGGKLQVTYHDTGTYFYLGDWLGTKRVEVGAGSSGISCAIGYASLPYGNGLTSVALPGYSQCVDATEHHFTQKERDSESNNDYFFARYYNSAIGRFTTPDWSAKVVPVPYAQMADPQTLNLYAYVGNNPMTRTDSDGHGCITIFGKLICIGDPPPLPPPPPTPLPPPPPPTPMPQGTTVQEVNAKVITKDNSAFNQCVNNGNNKAGIKGSVNAIIDNKPSGTQMMPSGNNREMPKAADDMSTAQMAKPIKPIAEAVLDLHSECLVQHPLAALDQSYVNKVSPGDVGRTPEWLDLLGKLIQP